MNFLPALAVVVLYKTAPESSRTLQSLLACVRSGAPLPQRVFVFDNEGDIGNALAPILAELGADYVRSENNVGIAGAYEAARICAQSHDLQWLWLFDQDSYFDHQYMRGMASAFERAYHESSCISILPRVNPQGKLVSPLCKTATSTHGYAMTAPGETVRAINAGMLLRRAFIDELGGFDQRFWLDGLDHWLCLSARDMQRRFVIADAALEHDLSVASRESYVSVKRYCSILKAETRLSTQFYTSSEKCRYFVQLCYRCVKHPLRWRTFKYLLPTLRQMWGLLARC